MKEMLAHRSQWPTDPTTEEDRAADLIEALEFGNHKGATTQQELLLKLVSGDIKYGYALPPPLGKIKRIPGICMARGCTQEFSRAQKKKSFGSTYNIVHKKRGTKLCEPAEPHPMFTPVINR